MNTKTTAERGGEVPAQIISPDTIHSGRFASRAIDSTTLRVGRSGTQNFRTVNYMDVGMRHALRSICYVPMDYAKTHDENMKLLQGVVDLLAAGQTALAEKRAADNA